ncbi:MAG: sorbosone dehydrogenase family protein [Sphingomonadaceae bacterium]|nr:sorbosone dehydrogenase family protein [Sphingomonadaceae bacterium]
MTRKRILLVLFALVVLGIITWLMIRPHEARLSIDETSGINPQITSPRPETWPTINVAEAVGWPEGEMPEAAEGLEVNLFADDLDHPRWMLTLDNGDVLVAESRQPSQEFSGLTGMIAERMMRRAGALGPSANRITLLRDVDGDGTADQRSALLTVDNGLNSPIGMAVTEDYLYVANTDALVRFAFEPGQVSIEGEGEQIVELPASGPNNHWTKTLVVSPADPNLMYVGVGSNSNIAEGGMAQEENRAAVLEINVEERSFRIFTAGLRNPVGLDWEPQSGRLYTVVNERDLLGGDLVPDYLTEVEFGAHYGWPGVYWGNYLDERVEPATPRMLEYAKRPDFALGPHTASLGLEFADNANLGSRFANGAFIGQHGSWNRNPRSGYKVVFVRFENGRPVGEMIDVLTGFLSPDGEAWGRPVGVMTDRTGALLVADDVGNCIWRVSNPNARAAAAVEDGAES